jgi:hypothetical protein
MIYTWLELSVSLLVPKGPHEFSFLEGDHVTRQLTVEGETDKLQRCIAQSNVKTRRGTTGTNASKIKHFRHD